MASTDHNPGQALQQSGNYPVLRPINATPQRSDFRATEFASVSLSNACVYRDRARSATRRGESALAQIMLLEMRWAARTALLAARRYRRNRT